MPGNEGFEGRTDDSHGSLLALGSGGGWGNTRAGPAALGTGRLTRKAANSRSTGSPTDCSIFTRNAVSVTGLLFVRIRGMSATGDPVDIRTRRKVNAEAQTSVAARLRQVGHHVAFAGFPRRGLQ
jgi:hypothetical protein